MSSYATAQDWKNFLRPLLAAVKNPPADANEFHARCCAAADALAIRAEWLTADMRREAMSRFQFWPSVAELGELFSAQRKHAMELHALRQHYTALPAPEAARPKPTPDEIAAARAKAQAFAAEMAALVIKEAPPAQARPLAPHHLLAQYEALAAQGNEAAALRAAQLQQAVRP